MKLYSWNVNGIRAVQKKNAFAPFLAEYRPDILCIQETKAQPDQIEIPKNGFEVIINSAERKGYSGTAILSKTETISVDKNIPSEIATKFGLTNDGYGDANTEGRILTAEYDDFYLVTVYTPNAKDDLSRVPLRHNHWDPAFLEHCIRLEKNKPVIFCGDLNVAHTPDDLARPKENDGKKGFTAEEREGFQNFINAGFVDTFRMFHKGNGQYTWWSAWGGARDRNVGWRIDYFLVSASLKNKVKAANIHPDVMGSDHCPVSLEIDF